MGTNYYLHADKCKCCGHGEDELHIGKSSVGWCFAVRIYPDKGINTLDDWLPRLKAGVIKDEYGGEVHLTELLSLIKDIKGFDADPDDEYYNMHGAQAGPNNLLRRKVGRYCVGHGEGTWDYLNTEFS